METLNGNLLLMAENNSDYFFPQVKEYIKGNLSKLKLLHTDCLFYKKEAEIIQNFTILASRNCDIISGIEISGIGENFLSKIRNIELVIGQKTICTFYLSECEIIEGERFLIKIYFDNIFLNYSFLPIVAIQFYQILFKINGHDLEDLNLKCFMIEGLLENNLRNKCVEMEHTILINHYERYHINMDGNRLYMSFGDNIVNRGNFIKCLKFQFERQIDFNTITIYGNNQHLTTLTKSDIKYQSDGFLIDNFYYKTFLYNKVIIEFDENIENTKLVLLTTNFNMINIKHGMCALKYMGVRRKIDCMMKYFNYKLICEQLYLDKVLKKEDKICAISRDEFEENEERIICGKCFTSYKRFPIEEWFKQKNEKICPYGRCEMGIWYIRT